jgi:hypothetical protein
MTQYRGYYIDRVIFNSKEEIDSHIKAQAIESYIQAIRFFLKDSTMEASIFADHKAEYLHSECGMDWSEIEEIEIMEMGA